MTEINIVDAGALEAIRQRLEKHYDVKNDTEQMFADIDWLLKTVEACGLQIAELIGERDEWKSAWKKITSQASTPNTAWDYARTDKKPAGPEPY